MPVRKAAGCAADRADAGKPKHDAAGTAGSGWCARRRDCSCLCTCSRPEAASAAFEDLLPGGLCGSVQFYGDGADYGLISMGATRPLISLALVAGVVVPHLLVFV